MDEMDDLLESARTMSVAKSDLDEASSYIVMTIGKDGRPRYSQDIGTTLEMGFFVTALRLMADGFADKLAADFEDSPDDDTGDEEE